MAHHSGHVRQHAISQDHAQARNGKVTGAFASGKKLEGTLQGSALHFIARDGYSTIECSGAVSGGAISGKFAETFPDDPKNAQESPITATRVPAPRSGPPQRHEFTPTIFYREFSASTQPVLRIWPGDTIHTTTVDAGGRDERGIKRAVGGNPETGPFYIETAWFSDTLAVHFTRIRLNRDYAISDDGIAIEHRPRIALLRLVLEHQRDLACDVDSRVIIVA